MTEISEVVPSRIRAGDQITINGFGFSPSFGANAVQIGGLLSTILSETEFQLLVEVPFGIPSEEYVALQVQRTDNFDNDVVSLWSSGLAADLASGAMTLPGQVPGEDEAAAPAFLADTPQAQDYERMATLAEFFLREVWGAKGDLLAHDGASSLQLEPVGAAGELLSAAPAAARGLAFVPAARQVSLYWGKAIDQFNGLNGPMTANGDGLSASLVDGDQPAGQAGTITAIGVLVQSGVGPDTLDLVRIHVNGIQVFAGAALGIAPGATYTAAPGVAVLATDRVEIQAFKAGVSGPMTLRGRLVIQ